MLTFLGAGELDCLLFAVVLLSGVTLLSGFEVSSLISGVLARDLLATLPLVLISLALFLVFMRTSSSSCGGGLPGPAAGGSLGFTMTGSSPYLLK